MTKKPKNYTPHPDEPLFHACHKRPVTRRDMIAQGMLAGTGTLVGTSLLGVLSNPLYAELSPDIADLRDNLCGLSAQGAGKIPFIAIELAGGANMAGSNVLVGGRGGQLDFLTTEGYSKMGLPGDMVPNLVNPDTETRDFINNELGLSFHSDSAFLRGILDKFSVGNRANVNGAVIPARSENDTANNPHNPMYGIYKAGAGGSLLDLIGSQNTQSGARSMAPSGMIIPAALPTKVDRPSDVTGLVDVGDLLNVLSQEDAVRVMESMQRISEMKMTQTESNVTRQQDIEDWVNCGYVKSADLADRFGDPTTLDPTLDTDIVGASGIFSQDEFDNDREFQKTASVMKMVINGYAGAGTITMGGYDYHGGGRRTGEVRDFRAGRCMGACLEYAARMNKPLMLYVYSDGSLASDGTIDDTENGRGKGNWTGDNSSTAASFFLVYNPNGRAQLIGATPEAQAVHQQLGYMRPDASVETSSTPAANNVNLLVETVILNYMALHGEQNQFAGLFPTHGLGNSTMLDSLTAFEPIVNGTISR
ncbi:general secretion pathway protein GspF [Pleionea sediminis]|uniref:general secretion pathway protein GspF n=1 Tax=Pleionea sediminis TaxID=2569479 RepID=UPI001184F8F1|nr:general secretion pathway protein GspF [Pleionea sediminis]